MEPIFRWAWKMAIAIPIHRKSNSHIWTNSWQTLGELQSIKNPYQQNYTCKYNFQYLWKRLWLTLFLQRKTAGVLGKNIHWLWQWNAWNLDQRKKNVPTTRKNSKVIRQCGSIWNLFIRKSVESIITSILTYCIHY